MNPCRSVLCQGRLLTRAILQTNRSFAVDSEVKREASERLLHVDEQFSSVPREGRNRVTFHAAIDLFRQNRTQTRGHVEFINTALNYIKEYGLHKDLDTYKALLNVFPKGKMIPTNSFQKIFLHYPVQQNCCVKVLDLMEWHGVQPDKEVHDIVANAFGEWNFATKKIKRMLYWMPKLKHSNKYLDRRTVENKNLTGIEMAAVALKMMARDPGTDIDYVHYTHSAEFDDKWVVSAQSPVQQSLLSQLPDSACLYVDAPRTVYVMDQKVEYAVLSTDPSAEPFDEFEDDHVEDPDRFESWKSPWERDPFMKKRTLHEQSEQTILGLAVFEECTQEAAASWVNHLQKAAPKIGQLNVLFRLVPVNTSMCSA
uniref:Evolutionarily conserved signaling intermediate in Toll pathway, mitochondrial n=1 Tax=Steinernema glaseri TaxID=37863 RepID=A0A1I7YPU6_9BILA